MRKIGIAVLAAAAFAVGLWVGSDDSEVKKETRPEVTAKQPAAPKAPAQSPGQQTGYRTYPPQEPRLGGGTYGPGSAPAPWQDQRAFGDTPDPGVAYQYSSPRDAYGRAPYGAESAYRAPVGPSTGGAYRDPYGSPYPGAEAQVGQYRFRPFDEGGETKRWTGNFPAPQAPGPGGGPPYESPYPGYPTSPGPTHWHRNSSRADSSTPLWAIQL